MNLSTQQRHRKKTGRTRIEWVESGGVAVTGRAFLWELDGS